MILVKTCKSDKNTHSSSDKFMTFLGSGQIIKVTYMHINIVKSISLCVHVSNIKVMKCTFEVRSGQVYIGAIINKQIYISDIHSSENIV